MRKEFEGRTEFSQADIDNWFDLAKPSEIEHDVIWINEPFHYEDVNCFLVLGKYKDLLIDTGMGIKAISPLLNQIRDNSKELIIVNTHWHFDHIGGNSEFNQVLVPADENELKGFNRGWSVENLNKYGFYNAFIGVPSNFNKDQFCLNPTKNIVPILKDGFIFDLGDRQIEVIETPGHTPGSISFFDRGNGLLFTGDFLYEGPLYSFEPESDLNSYLNSLKKVSKLSVNRIYPGHNHPNNQDFPNLIPDALQLFERACNREPYDASGEFPGSVEFCLKSNQLTKKRLKIIVANN